MFGTRKPSNRDRRCNQCWLCQEFFNSSGLCHLPMKCLKCAGSHQAKDCTLQFEDLLKCANCGGKQAANWRQCPRFPKSKKAPNYQNKAISNDAGVDQNLLAKVFRFLPLNDANEEACFIFEAVVQGRPNAHSLTFHSNVQSLSICFWKGLRPKIHDFVSEKNPDLLLVQETKLYNPV
ncbi:uncharacterized protein TNCV_4979491 [Trichonephila clavipes]|nr:uncharacterized protein TNCV_4979491 [Trichonephila clavipes]